MVNCLVESKISKKLFFLVLTGLCLALLWSEMTYSQNAGGVLLKWTAPGDDGYTGRAAGYDLRYQHHVKGPIDTEAEWNAATKAYTEPVPSFAGQTDSAIVNSLIEGESYYFSIRTRDLAGNYSVLSNSPHIIAGPEIVCCQGARGNVNCDPNGSVDGADLAVIISHLFITLDPLCCETEANLDLVGGVDGADLAVLIDHLFINLEPLASCEQ